MQKPLHLIPLHVFRVILVGLLTSQLLRLLLAYAPTERRTERVRTLRLPNRLIVGGTTTVERNLQSDGRTVIVFQLLDGYHSLVSAVPIFQDAS